MNAHLSSLALDELATGMGQPADRAHLETCPDCRGRARRLEADRHETKAMAGYARTLGPGPGPLEAHLDGSLEGARSDRRSGGRCRRVRGRAAALGRSPQGSRPD